MIYCLVPSSICKNMTMNSANGLVIRLTVLTTIFNIVISRCGYLNLGDSFPFKVLNDFITLTQVILKV